ncbi:hypothetical protein PZB75_17025 [Streptomyces sp. AM 4-1-1]|uniref:hypothetical protein n=1 Tax=Streptomyces sp. AM 4-1-1 TaxID=3028710 RepID=UPI0023BA09AB|nr:hypothetical protein [Streptomyces sp. AM 4-1-1]WEH34907.1 hypothetical protein PZB75_17025 [Streptomyces sp. AM 4-1-1]
MTLEEGARRLEAERQAEAERRRRQAEDAENALAPLLGEFADALRKRGRRPSVAVHGYRTVEPTANNFRRFYVTPDIHGHGWVFSSYWETSDGSGGTRLVLMEDGRTLVMPLTEGLVKRPTKRFFRGYWPKEEFVCWSHLHKVNSMLDVEPVRDGMIRHLDRLDHPSD